MKTRTCKKCGETKPESENYFRSFKRKKGGRGWPSKCRACQGKENYKHPNKQDWRKAAWNKEQERKGREASLNSRREYHLLRKYGITIETWDAIFKEQEGLCYICQKAALGTLRLSVDHDHITGHVRGLLCKSCNRGLGYFKDNPERMTRAAEYLKEPPAERLKGHE